MKETPYHHEPLKNASEQIRILTILPANDTTSIVRTQLSTHYIPRSGVPFQKALAGHFKFPRFEAISYVWATGPAAQKDHCILIDGQRFQVAGNVDDILRACRSRSSFSERYWIDCICIDQTNKDEISQQVPLMRNIYTFAQTVIVWLNSSTDQSEEALQFISKLINPISTQTKEFFSNVRGSTNGSASNEAGIKSQLGNLGARVIKTGKSTISTATQQIQWVDQAWYDAIYNPRTLSSDIKEYNIRYPEQQPAKSSAHQFREIHADAMAAAANLNALFWDYPQSAEYGFWDMHRRGGAASREAGRRFARKMLGTADMSEQEQREAAYKRGQQFAQKFLGRAEVSEQQRQDQQEAARRKGQLFANKILGVSQVPGDDPLETARRTGLQRAARWLGVPNVSSIPPEDLEEEILKRHQYLYSKYLGINLDMDKMRAYQDSLKVRKMSGVDAATVVQRTETLLEKNDSQEADPFSTEDQVRDENSSWNASSYALKLLASEDLTQMARLIQHTLFTETKYFTRMWTLQEPCVARKVLVTCGKTVVPLDDLLRVVIYLSRKTGIDVDEAKALQIDWIKSQWRLGRRVPLRVLLYESRHRQCWDPRDRIYSLLGLMYDTPSELLTPDYSRPVAHIYADVSRFLITSDKSLDLICGDRPSETIEGLPSWAQDFRHFGTCGASSLIDLSGRCRMFRASLSEGVPEMCLNPHTDWRLLNVTGICLGTVKRLSQSTTADTSWIKQERRWSEELRLAFLTDPEVMDALDAASQAVALLGALSEDLHTQTEMRTSLNDLSRWWKSETEAGRRTDMFTKYLLTLLCGRIKPRSRCNTNRLKDYLSQMCDIEQIGTAKGSTSVGEICEALQVGIVHRQLCISDDPQKWGMCPKNTVIDDQIFVLMGCSVPVILRQSDADSDLDGYAVIGECYLHDFMNGEALKLNDKGVLQQQKLVLR